MNFGGNWIDYKRGFGDILDEFWIGNDNIHFLTTANGDQSMRVDMWDCAASQDDVGQYFEEYPLFYVWLNKYCNCIIL